ncbi:MAG: hypothetical protein Q8N77_04275 [Nanoarchaeota archaeon]|nr:hypothetical protein [Nanoarchaeota archaeon]
MRIPQTFLPEKNLDKKITDLSSARPYKIKDLEDLVLWSDSDTFTGFINMPDDVLDSYSLLNSSLVEEKIIVDYESLYVHIMEFLDEDSLKSSLKGVTATVNGYNKDTLARCNALFKDKYLVFIYFSVLDHKKEHSKLAEGYKRMGFKEVK